MSDVNGSLIEKLKALAIDYPELRNYYVEFSENELVLLKEKDIEKSVSNTGKNEQSRIPICRRSKPGPEIIRGHSPKIELRKSPIHGYGVFAKEMIEQGEFLEEHKILRLNLRSRYMHDSVLSDYVWGGRQCECDECKTHGRPQYLALGFGSMYNHSETPNTYSNANLPAEVKTIFASERIEKDNEIFLNYGKRYFLIRNFQRKIRENGQLIKRLEENNREEQKSKR